MPKFQIGGAPPPPGPRDAIVRVKANETMAITVLSAAWWSIVTHWDGEFKPKGRSMPCEHPEPCNYCAAEVPKRWKAYLHVLYRGHGRHGEGFLELTPGLAEAFINELGEDADLRGTRWQLTRGAGEKARIALRPVTASKAALEEPLPEERSPEFELMKLWGFGKRKPARRNVG